MYRRSALTSAMHVDLNTLYLLLIGTLFASALMTLWERRVHPKRSRELGILAAGFATLAIGCAAASWRREFPGALGSALSNLVIVSGYLLVLHGVAALNGRKHVRLSLAVLVIILELAASVMILVGFFRWLGALGLGAFTLLATFLALRFWELPAGMERFMAANSFFEHLGLVGGFLLVAWLDLSHPISNTEA